MGAFEQLSIGYPMYVQRTVLRCFALKMLKCPKSNVHTTAPNGQQPLRVQYCSYILLELLLKLLLRLPMKLPKVLQVLFLLRCFACVALLCARLSCWRSATTAPCPSRRWFGISGSSTETTNGARRKLNWCDTSTTSLVLVVTLCTCYAKCSNAQTLKWLGFSFGLLGFGFSLYGEAVSALCQMLKCTNAQMLKCTNAQMHKCSNAQVLKGQHRHFCFL